GGRSPGWRGATPGCGSWRAAGSTWCWGWPAPPRGGGAGGGSGWTSPTAGSGSCAPAGWTGTWWHREVDQEAAVLIVARHGRTAANTRGLLLGRGDAPLDAAGVRQAQALAAAGATLHIA